MIILDLKKDVQFFTGKLSEINRQICFAGIAVVWIFKVGESGNYSIPASLITPAIFLILSLCLDLFQYIYSSVIWSRILRIKEKDFSGDQEFRVPKIYGSISYIVFFYPKVFCTVIAYVLLFIHLKSLL